MYFKMTECSSNEITVIIITPSSITQARFLTSMKVRATWPELSFLAVVLNTVFGGETSPDKHDNDSEL